MADFISAALTRVRRTELANLPIDPTFEQLCAEAGLKWRERVFTPLLTLKLFVLQIAHGNTAINHLRHLSGLMFTAGSYCEARARLPLAALQELLAKLVESSRQCVGPAIQGARVLVVDATSFSMPDTPALCKHFGLPARQKPGIGYPVCKLMAILDLASGLFVRTLALPLFTHDMRGIVQLHPFLLSGDILVGDRAFCSVIHLAMLQARSIYCVFRLHQRRKVSRVGIVKWKRPKQRPG
jgi:Transposase DDE domain